MTSSRAELCSKRNAVAAHSETPRRWVVPRAGSRPVHGDVRSRQPPVSTASRTDAAHSWSGGHWIRAGSGIQRATSMPASCPLRHKQDSRWTEPRYDLALHRTAKPGDPYGFTIATKRIDLTYELELSLNLPSSLTSQSRLIGSPSKSYLEPNQRPRTLRDLSW